MMSVPRLYFTKKSFILSLLIFFFQKNNQQFCQNVSYYPAGREGIGMKNKKIVNFSQSKWTKYRVLLPSIPLLPGQIALIRH